MLTYKQLRHCHPSRWHYSWRAEANEGLGIPECLPHWRTPQANSRSACPIRRLLTPRLFQTVE